MDQQLKEWEAWQHRDLVNSSLLENLPIGIIQTILQNLSFPYLFRCTLLNKSFYKTMSTNMSFALQDSFLFLKLKDSLYYSRLDSMDEISANKVVLNPTKVNIDLQSSNTYITGSCNGYLCMSLSLSSLSTNTNGLCRTLIFNPLMPRNVKELSSASTKLSWASGFGFNPRTGQHKVVKVYIKTDDPSRTQHIEISNVGTNQWRPLDLPSKIYLRSRTSICARGVFLSNGWIYWLGERQSSMTRVIVGLNLNEESFKEIAVPEGQGRFDHYLIKARGELVLVAYNKSKNELQIWESEEQRDGGLLWQRSMSGIPGLNKRIIDKLPSNDDRDMYLAGQYNTTLYDVVYLEHDKLLLQFKKGVLCYHLRRKRFIKFEVVGLHHLGGDQIEFEAVVFHGSVADAERFM